MNLRTDSIITPDAKVLVLSGAGCSTESGLADYRDRQGRWKRAQPITGHTFQNDTLARHRYWARSAVGWPNFNKALPNTAHQALVRLEQAGIVSALVTQNVDELHQRAGQQAVIDLHGVLSAVACINCQAREPRAHFQQRLLEANPFLSELNASYAPDGDADLDASADLMLQIGNMIIPACPNCNGLLKPDVVFFGENVPKPRVEKAMQQLRDADVLMVAGSSLMVFSGYRFCKDAHQRGQPIVIVNDGKTRADDIATVKHNGSCAEFLSNLVDNLSR